MRQGNNGHEKVHVQLWRLYGSNQHCVYAGCQKESKEMRSIMQNDMTRCYLCGKTEAELHERLEEHHVIFGQGRRKLSEQYGLKIYLHGETCHRNGKEAPHRNRLVRRTMEAAAQSAFEKEWGSREEFMRIFGKNYL